MDTAHMTDVGWSPRKKGALDMIYGSRLLIERVLRDIVHGTEACLPRIEACEAAVGDQPGRPFGGRHQAR